MKELNIFDDIDDGVIDAQPANAIAVAPAESVVMSESEIDLANYYDLALTGNVQDLVREASAKTSRAQHMMVEAGLLLICAHSRLSAERTTQINNANPEFAALLEANGLPKQRASELMRIARYISTLSPEQRESMMGLGKKKILAFASTDLEVLDQMILEGEEFDFSEANTDATRRRIKELEAKLAQTSVERNRAEEKTERLERELRSAQSSRSDVADIVPAHVSDIRLEVAALYKKAELSIDGVARLHAEINLLDGEWSLSCARSTFAALQSLINQAKGAAAELHRQYGADLDGDNSTMERLTQKELFTCATEYKALVGEHEHEAALRAHKRDLDKPKGKGRPKDAPTKD